MFFIVSRILQSVQAEFSIDHGGIFDIKQHVKKKKTFVSLIQCLEK